ncbi:MAG: hypothetical protein COB93_03020 [Sneathiella sp.]|nr:MAG: hypothetical protein COB93_03020 [Sneathiella sp.]
MKTPNISSVGTLETDQRRELQRRLLKLSTLMMAIAAVFWGGLYYYFGEIQAALIPWSYMAISFVSLLIFRGENGFYLLRGSQLFFSLMLPFLVMWELGGFVNSSAVVAWSLICPMGALVFVSRRAATFWFIAFILLVTIGAVFEYPAILPVNALPDTLIIILFVMNISGVSIVAFVLLSYFVDQKDSALDLLAHERQRSENLIRNMLPAAISERLKSEQRPIADRLEGVTIIFADIVGFTGYAMRHTPEEIVTLLDTIFSKFDEISNRHDLEKIKTIGDAYMACGGLSGESRKGAIASAQFAQEAILYMNELCRTESLDLDIRIGIHTGPVVAGVIGHSKYSYDIWGDAVNIAARLQQTAEPGKVHLSKDTGDLLAGKFVLLPQGETALKGHTPLETFVLQAKA